MSLKDVWIKKIAKEHRGSPRFYLDGLQAIRAGFSPGEQFEVDVEGTKVVITKKIDGSRMVSSKRRKNKDGTERVLPVIDINSSELLRIFDGMDSIRVVVANGCVYLLPLASEQRRVERLNRLTEKLRSGEPLAAGSMAHGGGVLAHAVHTGLRDAGIECDLKFANELRDDLMLQALEHNDVWNENTAALSLPMQELAQDEWLLSRLPKLDIFEAGFPCSGASLAGHTKNKLEKMEDHEEVGHLVHAGLVIIGKTNPAVVLLENVPRYAQTASAQILRHQFRDMGYVVHEAVIDGNDFGSLENRLRWCLCAVTRGIEFSFESLAPAVRIVQKVGDIIDRSIQDDDPRWREVEYLKAKRVRNEAEGNGFKMQFVDESSTHVPTIRKGYNKAGSTDVRLMHPTNPDLSRLFTAQEISQIKGSPAHLIDGLSQTTAIQLLGQSIVYEPFRAAGQRVGEAMLRLIEENELSDVEEEQASQASLRRQRATG